MKQKGISLIALIITIIVIIILAVITIFSAGNVVEKAQEAKMLQEIANEKEILSISIVQSKKEMEGMNQTTLGNALDSLNGKGTTDVNENGIYIVVRFSKGGRCYFVDPSGNIEGPRGLEWSGMVSLGLVGLGTEDSPFLIQSMEDLAYMRNQVNGTENVIHSLTDNQDYTIARTAYYILTKDLYFNNLSEIANIEKWDTEPPKNKWTPIGENATVKFSGYFDGNGFRLIGCYVNDGDDQLYKGIFGIAQNAVIQNLKVVDSYVRGGKYIGGIVGKIEGTTIIDGCSLQGKSYVFGSGGGTYESSVFGGIGGVVGLAVKDTQVLNCYNNSSGWVKLEGELITGNPHGGVGGVLGAASQGESGIANCFNTCNVIAEFAKRPNFGATGGIVGQIAYVDVYNLLNTGAVTCKVQGADFDNRLGGVAGMADLVNCYNYGTVNGKVSKETTSPQEVLNILNQWVDENNDENQYKHWKMNGGEYPVLEE